MLTDDYIIRLINLGISALLKILKLKKSGDYEDALQLIGLTVEQLLGLKASTVKNLSDERLYDLLTRHDELDTQRLGLLADLMETESQIFTAQNRLAEAQEDAVRAVKYNLVIYYTDPTQDEVRQKIDGLVQTLDPAGLDSDVLWSLASFYDETEGFQTAEFFMLRLVELPAVRENILPELVAFYTRLSAKTPAELARFEMDPAHIQSQLKKYI